MQWEIIREMDDENGKPTCWATEVNNTDYGKFIWVTKFDKNRYFVEYKNEFGEFEQLAKFSSLKKAKEYAEKLVK